MPTFYTQGGPFASGAAVGFSVVRTSDRSVIQARTTTGVAAFPTPSGAAVCNFGASFTGSYGVEYTCTWDDGAGQVGGPDRVFVVGPVVLEADGLDAVVCESGLNARQALSLAAAGAAGSISGVGTATITVSGAGVSTTRTSASIDVAGDRAVTVFPPS